MSAMGYRKINQGKIHKLGKKTKFTDKKGHRWQ